MVICFKNKISLCNSSIDAQKPVLFCPEMLQNNPFFTYQLPTILEMYISIIEEDPTTTQRQFRRKQRTHYSSLKIHTF